MFKTEYFVLFWFLEPENSIGFDGSKQISAPIYPNLNHTGFNHLNTGLVWFLDPTELTLRSD